MVKAFRTILLKGFCLGVKLLAHAICLGDVNSYDPPEARRLCVRLTSCLASDNLRTFSPRQLVLITENKWQHLVRFMGLLQRAGLV